MLEVGTKVCTEDGFYGEILKVGERNYIVNIPGINGERSDKMLGTHLDGNRWSYEHGQVSIIPLVTGTFEQDSINSPSHYANRKIEVFDFIEDTLESNDAFNPYDGYQYGSVIKYLSRAGLKVIGDHTSDSAKLEDLQKAKRHLDTWIEKLL